MEPTPVFRAIKRRKQLHARHNDGDDTLFQDNTETAPLVKAYIAKRPKAQGLQVETVSRASVPREDQTSTNTQILGGVNSRFISSSISQTPLAVPGTDATLKTEHDSRSLIFDRLEPVSTSSADYSEPVPANKADQHGSNPLVPEVDLASLVPAGRARNVAVQQKRPKKPRLGRDGKPFRSRPRRGPDEDDIARDALVDRIARESTGEEIGRISQGSGRDQELEEAFRARFEATVSARERGEGMKGTGGSGTGPRLGGGRSARAKIAAQDVSGTNGRSGGKKS